MEICPFAKCTRLLLIENGVPFTLTEGDHKIKTNWSEAISPYSKVPVLERGEDMVWESLVFNEFFEETHPEPNLLGSDPTERALIAMWDRYMELDGVMAVAEALRNRAKGMQGRALTGRTSYAQIPELAERGRKRTERFFAELEARLGESEYIAGGRYSVADITALVTVDFAKWLKITVADDQKNLRRWYDTVAARQACQV